MMTSVAGALAAFGEGAESIHLLARVASGSSAALAEVYDLYADRVYAFSRRLLGDDAAAEDLLHEVFVTLPAAARSYRGDANVRTFLLSIAHNHARHHIRAAIRRRAAIQRLEGEHVHSVATPHHDAERKELAQRLQRALDKLPIEQRVAFVLCDVEEQTSVEAAAVVGVPEGTIRTRVFHARRKLRELLEEDAP
jgi:RNA polymerase sigma-70 factor (ECF subfamily)